MYEQNAKKKYTDYFNQLISISHEFILINKRNWPAKYNHNWK
jgi:hypothetical protein